MESSLGKVVLFPIISVGAVVVVLFLLDLTGVGEVVREIVGIITFSSMLTLLYTREWYRGRHAAED
jgi:hypothetical protein